MSQFTRNRRIETAQRNPATKRFGRRATDRAYPYPAAFVTQIMTEDRHAVGNPIYMRPPRNSAVEAYRAGAGITQRRAPSGLSHAEDI